MNTDSATPSAVQYLVAPGTAVETNGAGAAFALGALKARPLLLVLRIEDIIEQESLHVSIWGSADGKDWGTQALFWYPQKFYRGAAPAALDLRQRPEIQHLQARWELNRWGRGYPRPRFRFAVEIQELEVH
ncbi:MAG: hypothetical protein LAP13_02410 [Acidobacteriia bacterium]|nr:hypothetical protein [Terriglobia bacterium]